MSMVLSKSYRLNYDNKSSFPLPIFQIAVTENQNFSQENLVSTTITGFIL